MKHPLIEHLAEKLLNVFVSIEMTGQSVQFEQKFNYRRPMYMVLEHIWEITLHKTCIKVSQIYIQIFSLNLFVNCILNLLNLEKQEIYKCPFLSA